MRHPDDDFDSEHSGDPRRCPAHPRIYTSDPWGLFDAPCPACEDAMEAEEREASGVAEAAPTFADDDLPF